MIKYKNSYGNSITEQQASIDFDKEYYINDVIKQIDHYEANELDYITYYLSPEENLNAKLSEFNQLTKTIRLYSNKEVHGNFTSWMVTYYENLVLSAREKWVFDNLHRVIAKRLFRLDGSTIEETIKSYYLPNINLTDNTGGIPKYGQIVFYYEPDPEDNYAGIHLDGFEDDMYKLSIHGADIFNHFMIAPLFNWQDHPYYHNAEPFVPTTPNI